MKLPFDQVKAVQAAAKLIRLSGEPEMDKLKLVKLLYLVDRESMTQRGCPVIGGSYVSMPHGPVTSEVLDSMNFGVTAGWELWERYLVTHGHRIELVSDPGEDALARREIGIIERVWEQFGGMDTFALRDYTHELGEWEDPNGSGIEIPLEHFVAASGHSWEETRRIVADLAAGVLLDSFASVRPQ